MAKTDVLHEKTIQEIPGSAEWSEYKLIRDHETKDKKFQVRDTHGRTYLLQMAEKTDYDRKKNEYFLLDYLFQQRIPVPQPLQFGVTQTEQSIYMLLDWFAGQNIVPQLTQLDPVLQYSFGHELAVYIAAVHNVKNQRIIPKRAKKMFPAEMNRAQDTNLVCIRKIINYLEENKHVVRNRPQTLIHGQLTLDSIIITRERSVYLTASENWRLGDPLEDIASVIVEISPISEWFATGFLDCYFSYRTSTKVFQTVTYYTALHALNGFLSCSDKNKEMRNRALKRIQKLIKTYHNMNEVVPCWYKELPRM